LYAEYYNEQFDKYGEPQYAHLLGTDFFKKRLKGKRYLNMGVSNLLYTKAKTRKFLIDESTYNNWNSFCAKNNCSIESLLLLGCRTYLSRINECSNDITIGSNCRRRSTLMEKNTGGCFSSGGILRTVIDNDSTFSNAIEIVASESRAMYRRLEINNLAWMSLAQKKFNIPPSAMYMSAVISIVIDLMPKLAAVCKFDMDTFYDGTWLGDSYQIMFHPDYVNNGLCCSITFKTNPIIEPKVVKYFEGVVNAINIGVSNPDIKLNDLLKKLD